MEENHKHRVEGLLKQAMHHAVILIEAAPGYGKSEQVKAFLNERKKNYAWLRLRKMDNHLFFHWKQLLKALNEIMPEKKEALHALSMPDEPAQIAELIEIIEMNDEEAVLVIDDYSLLTDQKVLFLYENLIEASFEKLTLIVISSRKTELGRLCIKSNVSFYLIGEEELRLSSKEVQSLFKKNRLSITQEQAEKLTEKWYGWPLPLSILAEQHTMADETYTGSLEKIQQLCYFYLYRNYSKQTKKLLIKLALVDVLPLKLLDSLDEEDRELLENHPMFFFDYKKGVIHIQETYKEFLRGYQAKLSDTEKKAVMQLVATILFKQNDLEEALPLLLKSGLQDQAVEAIWQLMTPTTDYNQTLFLFEQSKLLSKEYLEEHPRAELQRVSLLFFLGKTDRIEPILTELLEKLEDKATSDKEILGEIHFMLSRIMSMKGEVSSLEHIKIASTYLPDGSRYWGEPAPIILKASWLRLPRYEKGVNDQLIKAQKMYEAVNPSITILLKGRNIYVDRFFAAEIAYYTFKIKEAKVRFLELLYIGKNDQIPEIILLAREYLLRIGLVKGELQEAQNQLKEIGKLINELELYQYNGLHAQLTGWIALYLQSVKDVPSRMIEESTREKSKWEIVRNGFTQARYMIQTYDFWEAIALLNYLEEVYRVYSGHWLSLMYVKIYRAITYSKIGNRELAIRDLEASYEMSFGNNIITPFIGCAGDMRYLIQIAREDAQEKFDDTWLDLIFTKAKGLERKVGTLRKQNDAENQTVKLTPRRKEILQDLAKGLTAEEIAEQRHIAVTTVRTHIKNIYGDLGAVNRADAVRIAVSKGLI
ncbi:hypothetical protein NRIC_26140 [Enterococcus florum]|uniref:HTH luxR-type domain-containing protein n=1 Tax=Enterococcus florum TaxID=2480627 RepID=A0A4P5PNH2_9ENTE|nr:LuxR C-terminal-related transcriptional regulator [Enterococcus florum]GCF94723.1 hypothetical protein NRIC_26140 [Enterococcus florum]